MKSSIAAALLALGLLAACSKTGEDNRVVSPPEQPVNAPVNTDSADATATQTPGANSFTSDQARGHIENAGYTNVGELTQGPDGRWTGAATKDGRSVSVSVDYKGVVSENPQ